MTEEDKMNPDNFSVSAVPYREDRPAIEMKFVELDKEEHSVMNTLRMWSDFIRKSKSNKPIDKTLSKRRFS